MTTPRISSKPVAYRPYDRRILGQLDQLSAECVLLGPPPLAGDLVVAREWQDSGEKVRLALVNLGPIHSIEIPTTDGLTYSVILQSVWEAFKSGEIPLPRALNLSLVETVDY